MKLGLRQLLLIAAVILFVWSALTKGSNSLDLLAYGLACTAAALAVPEIKLGGRFGLRR